jgi:hypothetical protein
VVTYKIRSRMALSRPSAPSSIAEDKFFHLYGAGGKVLTVDADQVQSISREDVEDRTDPSSCGGAQ